jgi:hypothetical protein
LVGDVGGLKWLLVTVDLRQDGRMRRRGMGLLHEEIAREKMRGVKRRHLDVDEGVAARHGHGLACEQEGDYLGRGRGGRGVE